MFFSNIYNKEKENAKYGESANAQKNRQRRSEGAGRSGSNLNLVRGMGLQQQAVSVYWLLDGVNRQTIPDINDYIENVGD